MSDSEASLRSVPALVCVAAVLVMATAAPALAAGGWTVQYPQNPVNSIDAALYAVSCNPGATQHDNRCQPCRHPLVTPSPGSGRGP